MAATQRQASSIWNRQSQRDQFEAMASLRILAIIANRRFEGMINIPIVDDRLDIRVRVNGPSGKDIHFNEDHRQPHRWS